MMYDNSSIFSYVIESNKGMPSAYAIATASCESPSHNFAINYIAFGA